MPTIKIPEETEASGRVKEIFDDIKKFFGMPRVPTLFRAMSVHPDYLAVSWPRVKAIMGSGQLDRRTKEIIALAVSATNNCEYCINAHTMAAKSLGLKDEEIVEVMAVVDLFNGLNKFLDGLGIRREA